MADNVSMKDFLTQYFMQRVFNAMSDEQFARYQDIIKSNDFIGNMKDWKDKWKLVKEVNGKWGKNDAPTPDAYGLIPGGTNYDPASADKEWEKLYKELRNAFRKVANGRDRLDDKDDAKTITFLNNFYGFGQLFSPAELTGPAAVQLSDELLPFLKSNKTNLYQALKDLGIYQDTESKFSDFIGDLGKGKHNTDNEVRDMLTHIIGYLQSSYYGPAITERMGGATIPNLEVLANGLENDDVDQSKLAVFKDNYKLILNPIQSEKNIYQNFSPYLKSVKDAIETAKKRVDYNNADSKDFLTEKRPDEKGPIEKTVDNVKQWWGDHTDKFFSLHKSRLFYSDEAKAISKAIDAAKFKPTDGLDKFVSSLKDIGGKVKGNKAKQHFKWFSDTMTKLQGDKQMKSIFAGALKNPRKLKELAAEIAIQGIKDGKKDEEIHTAMEVLKTIQYGYVTSNHLDAVMKQDLNLFSDKSLSWNKNEGMNFVMTGVDKTINFAIKGTAVAFTMGYNIINRKIGNKFGGNVPKRAAASFQSHQAKLEAQGEAKEKEKTLLDDLDIANRTNAENERNATGITADTLDTERNNLDVLKRTAETKQTTLTKRQQKFDIADEKYQSLNNVITAQDDRTNKLSEINTQLTDLQRQIDDIDAKGAAAKPSEVAALSNLLTQKESLVAEQNRLNTEIANNLGAYASAQMGIGQATTDRDKANRLLNNAQRAYTKASNKANDLDSRIEKFNTATQRIQDADGRLTKRQEEFDKWQNEDKKRFSQLMAHWDFLNSGRMRTGENVFMQALEGILPLSQESRQKRYKGRRKDVHDAFLAHYQNKHGLVA